MTVESLYESLVSYRTILLVVGGVLPWGVYALCAVIPGKKEESYLLSFNLWISLLLIIFWIGYLIYALSGGGINQIAKEADIMLLLLPVYHTVVSLWLSKKRIPLVEIPAYRVMKGLGLMSISFVALVWVASKIRIVFFSYLPFSTFLYIAGFLIGIGYLGLRYLTGKKRN